MTHTVQRRKIEILVDAPLVRRIVAAAEAAGVTGYTLLPTLGGAGHRGRWSDDQLTGAEAKVMFVTIANDAKADALVDALAPLLESHGLILVTSLVDVVRGAKF
jgi:nitrogen regulatory protein PII